LPFGSPEYVGLGFSVVFMLILVELFGSPFMKNCNVIIALLFGYMCAGAATHNGLKYVPDTKIKSAEPITFAWVENFPIGFYGPAVFPLLIAFLVTSVETVGDLTATYEASEEDVESEEFDKSVQGGLLSDGICSFFSALGTGMPNTTFSQNNGVISLTKCASRRAGIAAGIWLIALGVLSKISGIISSIPDSVIGGMTTFLFCNVFVSGLTVVAKADLNSRRNRIILAVSMGIGLGVAAVPWIFADQRGNGNAGYAPFWACTGPFRHYGGDCTKGESSIRDGVVLFLSTPYCIGTILAMFLNAILPVDMEVIGFGADEGKA
jgi:uracil-xanthine permease